MPVGLCSPWSDVKLQYPYLVNDDEWMGIVNFTERRGNEGDTQKQAGIKAVWFQEDWQVERDKCFSWFSLCSQAVIFCPWTLCSYILTVNPPLVWVHWSGVFFLENTSSLTNAAFCKVSSWQMNRLCPWSLMGFPGGALVKNPPANAGDARDADLVSGLGRSSGLGNGNSLQYSCLENSMDRETWRLQSMGSQRARHDCACTPADLLALILSWSPFPEAGLEGSQA